MTRVRLICTGAKPVGELLGLGLGLGLELGLGVPLAALDCVVAADAVAGRAIEVRPL
jgi:hypothetical protein